MTTDFNERARRLRNAVEPVAAGVYFAPEAHAAYEALGFDGSPLASPDGIARPELNSYFTSCGACMGHVPGEVVASAFGVFNPKVVVPAVAAGWQITNRDEILKAREQAAASMLQRILGEQPDGLARVTDLLRRAADAAPWAGRGVYGGLRSLGYPDSPMGAMWRAADLVREHRGDSHVISWAVGGADAVEVLLLTEQWWGVPARSYTPSRAWQEADMDAGFERLNHRGLMSGEQLTDAGRAFREEIEARTDELERPLLEALGDDLDELLEHLDPWSEAIIAGGSYPKRIAGVYNVGGGPHFGSGLTIDTAAEEYEQRPETFLDGTRSYSVTLAPDIPEARFWSLTLYDNQTRSMLVTPQRVPRAGSQSYPTPAAVANDDGSTTIHMGPEQPAGVSDGNWIQTSPGRGFFALLRFYSPLAPFFDKSWRAGEIEPA